MRQWFFLCVAALLVLAGCSQQNPRVITAQNEDAALLGEISSDPLQWKVITSAVNPRDSTMWTLFGNNLAVAYARSTPRHDYPVGSQLSLVTWKQQEDRRWFGGRIPAAPESVEFVTVKGAVGQGPSYSYQQFEGKPLKVVSTAEGVAPNGRAVYLLSQRAAVMP